jgi:hypothetical protein
LTIEQSKKINLQSTFFENLKAKDDLVASVLQNPHQCLTGETEKVLLLQCEGCVHPHGTTFAWVGYTCNRETSELDTCESELKFTRGAWQEKSTGQQLQHTSERHIDGKRLTTWVVHHRVMGLKPISFFFKGIG